ncbi:Armadillo-like helical domain containing protein [Gracilaria domingensis]|nr:Armadillo-like helical domain containing protein [Gracilaria domingensis]
MKRLSARSASQQPSSPQTSRSTPQSTPIRSHRLNIRLPSLLHTRSLGRSTAPPASLSSKRTRRSQQLPRSQTQTQTAPVLYDMYHQRFDEHSSVSTDALRTVTLMGPIVRHEQSRSDSAYLPEIDATTPRSKRSFFPNRESSTFHVPASFSSRSRSSNAMRAAANQSANMRPRSTVDVRSSRALHDEFDQHAYDMDFANDPTIMLDDGGDDSDSQDETTVVDIRSSNHYAHDSAHSTKPKRKSSSPTNVKVRKIEPSPYLPVKPACMQPTAGQCKLYHAYTDALQREARGSAGGLRVIVDLLRESDGNPIVIEKAAVAIGILSENDSATRDVFGQHSAVQSLIQCLSIKPTLSKFYDRARIVSAVVYAVSCLLKDSPRNIRLFEMFDGPQKMGRAAASSRYENCPTIAKHALQALSELKHHPAHASESFIASSMSSSSSRTIKFVLKSMGLHEHRTDVQEYGLDALRTLLARAGRHNIRMDVLHLCAQATSTAFKMHHESKEVQWQCLTLLCDLDDMKDDLFSLELEVDCFFGSLHLIINEAKISSQRDPALEKVLVELITWHGMRKEWMEKPRFY